MKTQTLESLTEAAIQVHDSEGKEGKKALERVFGAGTFKKRPIGVWCLGTEGTIYHADQWSIMYAPQGVLVVTEETAFIVAPHGNISLPWGAMGEAKKPLITDIESFDSKAATDAMIEAYAGTFYRDKDADNPCDVEGAPAAELVRRYEYGSRGAGEWDLPTVAQLKVMYEHRKEINKCMLAIGGHRLRGAWHWSSIGKDESFAWCVGMDNGYTHFNDKYYTSPVRAVSAFQL